MYDVFKQYQKIPLTFGRQNATDSYVIVIILNKSAKNDRHKTEPFKVSWWCFWQFLSKK